MYVLAIANGWVQLDDTWIRLEEWPEAAWVHLPHLHRYKRATTSTDENGRTVKFQKGDARPDNAIVRWVQLRQDREAGMTSHLFERIRMMQDGHYPPTPSPEGCKHCECEAFCDRFDMGEIKPPRSNT
jgi:hypothetical protein